MLTSMNSLTDLVRPALLASCLWFLAFSLAAAITVTEPDIDRGDMAYRTSQAAALAGASLVCAALFWVSA